MASTVACGPQQALQMPMKVDSTLGPPPGLEHLSLQQPEATPGEYSVGEEVSVLRSNGSWSPGTIAVIHDDKVKVVLKDGVKLIRKEMMGSLLKKSEPLQPQSLEDALLATQFASLQAENARLAHENLMMRLESQSCSMYPVQDLGFGYSTQDPHGYMSNPWGIPEAACPPTQENAKTKKGSLASKLISKIGGKKNSNSSDSGSLGSISTSSGESSLGQPSSGDDEPQIINALSMTLPHERTTVMMCNIPNNVTRQQLLTLVNDAGFQGHYNLVYVPIDLKNKVGLGYAFLNFVGNKEAEAFSQHFQGFKDWSMKSEKVCVVKWSDALQGLDEHVERYRDCPVMHESIADEFKPVLFKDGVRVPFPEPTKKIRAPRPWTRRH